jgi:hypothetical protein
MDALERRMYSTGTVASVFVHTITQSRLTKKSLGAEALTAMKDIFHGNENPDPGAVTAALQPDTASARACLVVMNAEVGFTLLHKLQNMDQEIWPGDPIANRIVAFEGDICPQGFTPNIVVFNEAEDTLFQRFNLHCVRQWRHWWTKSTSALPSRVRSPTFWACRRIPSSLTGVTPGVPGELPSAVQSNPPRTHPFHPSVPQR